MVKISEFIRLGLNPELLKQARAEAKLQKISVNELIRTAIANYLAVQKRARIAEAYANSGKERRG